MEIWHKLDRSFSVPKISMELQFSSPIVYKSEENIAINKFRVYFNYYYLEYLRN